MSDAAKPILVVVDDKDYWFEDEFQADEFYRLAKVERYITVYDKDGKPAYGATRD